MAAQTIDYADKDKTESDERKQYRDIDANEVKTVVNNHAGLIDTAIDGVTGLLQSISSTNNNITDLRGTSTTETSSFVPDTGVYNRLYVVGGSGIEVSLPTAGVAPGWTFQVANIGASALTLVPQAVNVQILLGEAEIPPGCLVEVRRAEVGSAGLVRYTVARLIDPS